MTNWNLMYDKIPMPNSRFIALYTDGSGGRFFKSVNGKLYEDNVASITRSVITGQWLVL